MFVGNIKKNLLLLLPLLALAFLNTACELTDGDRAAIADAFEPELPPGTPPPDVAPNCINERYVQPSGFVTKRLDILFVVDTSSSLNEERGQIADGIDAFIQELPSDVLYNVGVMLGHGDNTGWSGRLYQKDSEPAVLKSTELSLQDIRDGLHDKLYNLAGDIETDGGEAGLYSLNKSLTDPTLLAEAQALGMYRSNAALAVVFVADENDICAEYPAGVTPVYDPNRREPAAYNKYCGGITAEVIAQNLKTVNGNMPLLVSGVIYNDPSTVPSGGENEVGYGFTDVIDGMSGLSIDLADGDYDASLSDIGSLASIKVNLLTDFTLANPNVDTTTIDVQVDGTSVTYNYSALTNSVFLPEPGGALSVVDVNYCLNDDLNF